ncbi:NAD(P)/FAD-dependent oxidoreductase [Psychroserpens ponticola]|uniref:FAD-dependent oxidoreductase n=1 Tax=Psychroserpens ponticola TaxID=2932268 RepID=A0ABY7RYP6_9FLAO|nr:FAD-dependent oxidoreductase [Psychroserpens ponticola]WCO02279.1 FAD-dependent oxidoreductase [Psychroserpens ponticola]
MKQVDYIIVGNGLAGIAFCEQLRKHNKDFVVFDNQSQQSSMVAAGLYNPVILKRFTKVWNAKLQLELAIPKYKELEELLHLKLDYTMPVYRKFTSVEEQNDWFTASDQPVLSDFLSTALIKNVNPSIHAEFGFGEVLHSGRIKTSQLIPSYRNYLDNENKLFQEEFYYNQLEIKAYGVQYKNIVSKYIVFAEGFGLYKNPFFKTLPLNGTKGEMLTIKSPDLKMNFILKSSVFIVPLGDDLYWIGATYEREDKSHSITTKAKDELIEKLKKIINCDFEIIHQVAGIRPTTKDRRPLVGVHPEHKNLFVLNGLGTRGVMISPFVAEQLFNHIEHEIELDKEINIKRFKVGR